MRDVFIIGSKGIPAKYGGFETFVDNLTEKRTSPHIRYHIACLAEDNKEFIHNNSRCFDIKVKDIGSAKAVIYDIKALKSCVKYIIENDLKDCIIYILACRIGPFFASYCKKIKKIGIKVYVNPDGHEWKRKKWNKLIRSYWKLSERLMVKYADLLICDSKEIEKCIKDAYKKYNPITTFISYGSEINKSCIQYDNSEFKLWYKKHRVKIHEYYLIVGRFVPENNYEVIIEEFMNSSTKKHLVIITNVENNKFYKALLVKTCFNKDTRIKFVGTVYDKELLKKIRENAHAYIHGHEVGGTNPSLLESLASTKINLLLGVGFNKEVAEDGALYFNKNKGNLCELINKADCYNEKYIENLSQKAKNRIISCYSWNKIVTEYESLFLKDTE